LYKPPGGLFANKILKKISNTFGLSSQAAMEIDHKPSDGKCSQSHYRCLIRTMKRTEEGLLSLLSVCSLVPYPFDKKQGTRIYPLKEIQVGGLYSPHEQKQRV